MSMIKYLEMLEFMRPAGSVYEEAFINRYIKPLNPLIDTYGNLIVDVGTPNILFSSHTDTVHRKAGLQRVVVDKNRIVKIKHPLDSNCLGADCTTGVYIMIRMIEAGVVGRYVFHREEEIGLKGSAFIAKTTPQMLKGISAAIAFDRKGKNDIITHMGGHRTCSNEFAESLALALDMKYKPCSHGGGTDTKSYMGLVPECTNISVGYESMHATSESQNLYFLEALVETMINFDSSGLVIKRTPELPPVYVPSTHHGYGGYGGYGGYKNYQKDPTTVFELCQQNPYSVSRFLMRMGWDFETLEFALEKVKNTPQGREADFDDLWSDAVADDGTKISDEDGNKHHKVGIA